MKSPTHFRCGCEKTPENTYVEAKQVRCLFCKRAKARRYQEAETRRRRLERLLDLAKPTRVFLLCRPNKPDVR